MREASPADLGVIKDTEMKGSTSSVAARLRAGAVRLITETYIQIESKLVARWDHLGSLKNPDARLPPPEILT